MEATGCAPKNFCNARRKTMRWAPSPAPQPCAPPMRVAMRRPSRGPFALASLNSSAHALAMADRAMARHNPAEALLALDSPAAQPLPPRGVALRAQAHGRERSRRRGLWPARIAEAATGAVALPIRPHSNRNWPRRPFTKPATPTCWPNAGKPCPSRCVPMQPSSPPTPNAPPHCAGTMPPRTAWNRPIDTRWDESLVALYGRLPIGKLDSRRASAQGWPLRRTPPARPCWSRWRSWRANKASGRRRRNSCIAPSPRAPAPRHGKNWATVSRRRGRKELARRSYANALNARGVASDMSSCRAVTSNRRSSTKPWSRNATNTACRGCVADPRNEGSAGAATSERGVHEHDRKPLFDCRKRQPPSRGWSRSSRRVAQRSRMATTPMPPAVQMLTKATTTAALCELLGRGGNDACAGGCKRGVRWRVRNRWGSTWRDRSEPKGAPAAPSVLCNRFHLPEPSMCTTLARQRLRGFRRNRNPAGSNHCVQAWPVLRLLGAISKPSPPTKSTAADCASRK